MPNKLSLFWQELKRRKVLRVITVYAAVGFVILQLVEILAPSLRLPDWTMNLILVMLIVGFIIAAILSWIYDSHPEGGIVKTVPIHQQKEEEIPGSSPEWKIASYISFVVIVGLIVLNIIPRIERGNRLDHLEKSIAVLPFESLSHDLELQYQADGIMDAIVLHLSRIEGLRVIGRTSVEQYRDTRMTVPEVCEEMGVSYVLEGSFQKSGNHIRLIVQLLRAGTEGHVWGNNYDREWKDIFAIQSEIAEAIADEIRAVIKPEVKDQIESAPTTNMLAWNLYLQGRHSMANIGGREGIDQSIQFYKQALELDPDLALAYSALATSYSAYAHQGILPRSEVMGPARDAAMKALSIDNSLGEAHAELAWTRIYQDFDWQEGESGLRYALQMNPNYAWGRQKYSWLLTFVKRFDEAITEAKYAVKLDPLMIGYWVWLGRAYLYAGRYDLAIEEFQKILSNYPNDNTCRQWLSITYLQKGMLQEAMEVFSKVSTKSIYWLDGYIYGMAGETEKAMEVLDYYLELSKTQYVKPTDLTVIYTALGEYDRALDYLEQAYEQHEGWLVLLQVEPLYDKLREYPRFQAILEKMNFPPTK